MLEFSVYRKRGRGWEMLYSSVRARSSRAAALDAGYVHNIKVVGVRPVDCHAVPLQVFRFHYTPTLTSASGIA